MEEPATLVDPKGHHHSLPKDFTESSSDEVAADQSIGTASAESLFVHDPLPHDAPSLRLIEIFPLSEDGIVRCQIRNRRIDQIKTKYTCLSYVWGSTDATQRIIINGKPFHVQRNLWDFLHAASCLKARLHPSASTPLHRFREGLPFDNESYAQNVLRTFWIDALSIDQNNTLERNHQVQQMGQIYSNARDIIAWMGNDRDIALLFQLAQHTVKDGIMEPYQDSSLLIEKLETHPYWKRAWITQEQLLGRSLNFFAQDVLVSMDHIEQRRMQGDGVATVLHRTLYALSGHAYWYVREKPRLINNIEIFSHKNCLNPRDMAYSLIPISCDGSKLEVNYDCSLAKLAHDILRIDAADICLRRVFTILQALRLDQATSVSEAVTLLIQTDGPISLKHIAPCFQCGEDASLGSPKLPPSSVTRMRCICLHCTHHSASKHLGIHRQSHPGHLVLIWARKGGEFDWHLFWAPTGGATWRILDGQKQVEVNEKGKFQSLILSVGVICELMALVSLQEARINAAIKHLFQDTYASSWVTKWKVPE